jgi:hypothetical protein
MGESINKVNRLIRGGVIPSHTAPEIGTVVVRAEFEDWTANGNRPKPLTTEQIRAEVREAVREALSEFQPIVRFEPVQMAEVRPIKARRA